MGMFTKMPRTPPYLQDGVGELPNAWQKLGDAIAAVNVAKGAYEATKATGDADAIATAKAEHLKALLAAVEVIRGFIPIDDSACRAYCAAKRNQVKQWLEAFTASLGEGGFKTANHTKSAIIALARQHDDYRELKNASECRAAYHGNLYELERVHVGAVAELARVRRMRGEWWERKLREKAYAEQFPGVTVVAIPNHTKSDGFHFVTERGRR